MNKYNLRIPNRRAVEKLFEEIEAHCVKRAKKLDDDIGTGNSSNQIYSTYKSYGINGIDWLILDNFSEVSKDSSNWFILLWRWLQNHKKQEP